MQQTLQLLGTGPPVHPQAYAASHHRLSKLMSQRAAEDDWIARLQARRSRLGRFDDHDTRKTLDADIEARKQQRRRLISRERHAERIVEQHERRYQALCDWHVDHLHQLAQGQWHACTLDRQDQVLDLAAAAQPRYLLAELGLPPGAPQARQVWRQGALAILRFRKDHHIEDPDRALGGPFVGTSERLHRSGVQLLVNQTRQVINHPGQPLHLVQPPALDLDRP